ncbi:MAG: hypothetical protein F4X35_03105 [Alphaproteobacteria bacterium]|nr:hypothetical protein [Alphaproteobacteria bacterium]
MNDPTTPNDDAAEAALQALVDEHMRKHNLPAGHREGIEASLRQRKLTDKERQDAARDPFERLRKLSAGAGEPAADKPAQDVGHHLPEPLPGYQVGDHQRERMRREDERPARKPNRPRGKRKRSKPAPAAAQAVDTAAMRSELASLGLDDCGAALALAARIAHADAPDAEDCPEHRIPTEEALAEDLHRIPDEVIQRLMADLQAATNGDGGHVWTWKIRAVDTSHDDGSPTGRKSVEVHGTSPLNTDEAARIKVAVAGSREWSPTVSRPLPLEGLAELAPEVLVKFVAAWQALPVKPENAHAWTVAGTRGDGLRLSRTPGHVSLSALGDLAVVEVDGETIAHDTPAEWERRRYRLIVPVQGELFPGPRKMDQHATGGLLMDMASRLPLTEDERSPLRADLLRAGTFAYSLSRTVVLKPGELSVLLTGKDTAEGRNRGERVLWLMRSLGFPPSPLTRGETWAAFDAEPGETHRVGPARWWLERRGMQANRLTGVLFRRIKDGRWGSVERTIAGIEGALLWGPSAGKGKLGRLPDAVHPEKSGGSGPERFLPWWQVLRLSGEHLTAEAIEEAGSTLLQRYNERRSLLENAGYRLPSRKHHGPLRGAQAPAGDTIEIVDRVRPARGREAGLIVRASARFCAAYGRGGKQERLPVSHLLTTAD